MSDNNWPRIEVTIPTGATIAVCRARNEPGSEEPYYKATTEFNAIPWLDGDTQPDAVHGWDQIRNVYVMRGFVTSFHALNLQEALAQIATNGVARYDFSRVFGDLPASAPVVAADVSTPAPIPKPLPTLPGDGPQPVTPPDINADMAKVPVGQGAATVKEFLTPQPTDPALLEQVQRLNASVDRTNSLLKEIAAKI